MNTVKAIIEVQDEQVKNILIAQLSEAGYDGFEENENDLSAFIKEDSFDAEILKRLTSSSGLFYSISAIPEQNWNALWESNFEPVIVNEFCAVRADFHQPITSVQHEIIITPKMSFGTGHHATTYMMMSEMNKLDFNNKLVADFGTGTGVLAIFAEKLGSKEVWATDHDEWSMNNSKENIETNNCTKIILEKADGFTTSKIFDIILANINKNVLLENTERLSKALSKKGYLLVSGLLPEDEEDIVSAFEQNHLAHLLTTIKDKWLCLLFALA